MSPISRRTLVLGGLAAAGAGALPAGLATAQSSVITATAAVPYPFQLGVASGEPDASSVVLWTRLAPSPTDADGQGGMANADVAVDWQVSTTDTFSDLTDGYGADVYLEGTGHTAAVPQGLNLLRKLGRYVEYGVFGSDVSVDWSIISDDKELDVLGAHLGPYCWPPAIKMLESGVLPIDRICSHQLPLADFQQGLDLVASGKESIKVSLIPGGTS